MAPLALLFRGGGGGGNGALNTENLSKTPEISQSVGLVDPKPDDPVILTTQSGLEIKFGLTAPETFNESLSSGTLAGWPYFTTTKSGTTYTWVIIGRSPDVTTATVPVQGQGSWQTGAINFYTWLRWQSPEIKQRFNFQTGNLSPAAAAIYQESQIDKIRDDGSYWDGTLQEYNISSRVANAEIPSGHVLCLLNSVGSDLYSIAQHGPTEFSNTAGDLRSRCINFYADDTFGFGNLKSQIAYTSLIQSEGVWLSFYTIKTCQEYFFPLGLGFDGGNFVSETYIPYSSNLQGCGQNWWFRDSYNWNSGRGGGDTGIRGRANADGTRGDSFNQNGAPAGIRPACCFRL